MSTSGRWPGACRAWLDGGYVCDLPRGHEDGPGRGDDLHMDSDSGDVWHDDYPGAHLALPPGPVPVGHPNYGKRDLIVDGDMVTIPHVVSLPRHIAELPPSLLD